jgi:pSer/pThr/pTyr-binding forkhead associated (FHA) protein
MENPANDHVERTLVGPQGQAPSTTELPSGFVPLRLVLLPSGVTLELDRPDMTLGRHSEADLRLPLPDVSRRHCRFLWAAGVWSVMDLGSMNGVFVNGLPVQRSDLVQDDQVRIGGFTFAVDLSYPDPPRVNPSTSSRMQSVIAAVQSSSRLTPYRQAS